jgi:hypothetical protein
MKFVISVMSIFSLSSIAQANFLASHDGASATAIFRRDLGPEQTDISDIFKHVEPVSNEACDSEKYGNTGMTNCRNIVLSDRCEINILWNGTLKINQSDEVSGRITNHAQSYVNMPGLTLDKVLRNRSAWVVWASDDGNLQLAAACEGAKMSDLRGLIEPLVWFNTHD